MPRSPDHISRNSKCKIRLPLMKDRTLPYESQVIKIVNRVFRRDVPQFGNCNWGYIEILCWGYQVDELREALIAADKANFAHYAVHVEKLDKWPSYPINATGDCDLTGIDCKVSYPNLIADQRKELAEVTRQLSATDLARLPVELVALRRL